MPVLSFWITLTTDAELGTGLGGDIVNALVPRNHQGQLMLPGSHIKGLMRQTLRDLAASLGWNEDIELAIFGQPDAITPGLESAIQLTDAVADVSAEQTVKLVTRTAVGANGVASDGSLRTTESISAGTRFRGQLRTNAPVGGVIDLGWRLALSAIAAVGGNRTRGSGICVVEIEGESRTPGELLVAIDHAYRSNGLSSMPQGAVSAAHTSGKSYSLSSKTVVLHLELHAETPICCPEIPDKTNVITSGFSIPASTVQGLILTRLNQRDEALATALYSSQQFRAWPMHPCWLPHPGESVPRASLPVPIRVSLTHRVAKFSAPDGYQPAHFADDALDPEPYDWTKVPGGAPLKASDGVLLLMPDGTVQLWKASTMPHVLSAHGVHSDPEAGGGRNLFTVDAMAPLIWRGLIVLPADAAEALLHDLGDNPLVSVGKGRSVRGSGRLYATQVDGVPAEWQTRTDHTVLVAQSPLLLPDRSNGKSAEAELLELAKQWANRNQLPTPKTAWANVGIRFGWNRHRNGLQKACRVALPGSVIVFDNKLDSEQLAATLLKDAPGLDGRERGFGAVSIHPGKAVALFEPRSSVPTVRTPSEFAEAIRAVLKIARKRPLPTPSQIRAVQQRLLPPGSRETAMNYFQHQLKRTPHIWFAWEAIRNDMTDLLSRYSPPMACKALEVLADLAIAEQPEGGKI